MMLRKIAYLINMDKGLAPAVVALIFLVLIGIGYIIFILLRPDLMAMLLLGLGAIAIAMLFAMFLPKSRKII